ncbi:MAG TPA: hypothetical protein DCE55_00485 [Planctomycetaceae bacterium]|nr:hypothetical protein [Planctomycetaceae bacterium]
MSLAITCTSCQHLLYVESAHANQLVRCPVCRSETRALPQSSSLVSGSEGRQDTSAAPEQQSTGNETQNSQENGYGSSDEVWFMVVPEGRTYGPVQRDELDRWVASGRVAEDCQLRCGGGAWASAEQFYPALKLPLASVAGRHSERRAVAPASRSGLPRDTVVTLKPDRGLLVLWIGILGSVLFFVPVFGVMAWVMGSSDLREMREGTMDSRGVVLTRAGQLLGMIEVLAFIVSMVVVLFGWLVFRVA